jgi:hypothetical protein
MYSAPAIVHGQPRIAIIDGCRVPFHPSGTVYKDLIAQDLGREAIKGLIARNAFDVNDIDYVCMGTVIQEGTCEAHTLFSRQRPLVHPTSPPPASLAPPSPPKSCDNAGGSAFLPV